MNCRRCGMIQMNALNINGRIDTEEEVISLCCESLPDIPRMAFAETPEETLRRFMGECALVSAESQFLPEDGHRRFTSGCVGCPSYQEGTFQGDGRIHYINLSMYPAPCQSQCMYCGVCRDAQLMRSQAAQAAYKKLFDTLHLAENCGLISPDTIWQVSSGEIAIHPYRDQIMELVRGKRTVFYTNCMKYDEGIAESLHGNQNAAINLSIDAGTPETWKKVKGIDNFDETMSNLVNYHTKTVRPEQITLKYIVLPDINDTYEDYFSLAEIMKVLKVKRLSISRDVGKKYGMEGEEAAKLLGGTAYLLAVCHKNGIINDMSNFTPKERSQAVALAQEILKEGKI